MVPELVTNPLKYYHNNTVSVAHSSMLAVRVGVPHFIFSSTAAIYGVPQVSLVTEDSARLPINAYGMSKLMTRFMSADVNAPHEFNYCALRYFSVAGADPQFHTGQSTASATHLIKVAVEASPPQTGSRRRVRNRS